MGNSPSKTWNLNQAEKNSGNFFWIRFWKFSKKNVFYCKNVSFVFCLFALVIFLVFFLLEIQFLLYKSMKLHKGYLFNLTKRKRLKWKEWSKKSVALKFIWPSAGDLPAQKKKDLFPKLADSICPPWTDAHLSGNHHFHFLSTYKCSLVNLELRKKTLNARPFWIEIKGIISNLCFAIYVCTCTRQIISYG